MSRSLDLRNYKHTQHTHNAHTQTKHTHNAHTHNKHNTHMYMGTHEHTQSTSVNLIDVWTQTD